MVMSLHTVLLVVRVVEHSPCSSGSTCAWFSAICAHRDVCPRRDVHSNVVPEFAIINFYFSRTSMCICTLRVHLHCLQATALHAARPGQSNQACYSAESGLEKHLTC
jgi:hypothetical protein